MHNEENEKEEKKNKKKKEIKRNKIYLQIFPNTSFTLE